jgi:flagellar hook-basal body complex protein FliE
VPTIPPVGAGAEFGVTGPEWSIETPDAGLTEAPAQGEGFGSMLGKQLQSLGDLQVEAADASQALATGTATDPAAVVVSVERARLAMQLASQLRTKGVEALNDVFHTQV